MTHTTRPNLTNEHHLELTSSHLQQLSQPATVTINSISPNLMPFLVRRSAHTDLLFESSTSIDSVSLSSISTKDTFQYIHSSNQTEAISTDATLFIQGYSSVANHSIHLHPLNTTRSNVWLVPYLVKNDMLHSTCLNSLTLCLLVVSLAFNLYLCLAILCGRTRRSRTNSLMQNIFVSNLLMAGLSLLFEVHLYLPNTLYFSNQIGQIRCKVIPSLQIVTE